MRFVNDMEAICADSSKRGSKQTQTLNSRRDWTGGNWDWTGEGTGLDWRTGLEKDGEGTGLEDWRKGLD